MLPLDVSVLQHPVLSSDMSTLHKPVLHPELPLDGSVLQHAAYAASGHICSKAACAAWTSLLYIKSICCVLSSRACAAFVHFCPPELCSASVLVCNLQEFCAAPGRECLQESSVCYIPGGAQSTNFLFVSVVSIRVGNTETNRNFF